MDQLMRERGVGSRQRFLCGDAVSAADITLAALSGPIIGVTPREGGRQLQGLHEPPRWLAAS